MHPIPMTSLRSLAPPQSHRLPVFLELGDQLISLLQNVVVLLVLIVRPVSLDHTFPRHPVDGTWDPSTRDEFGQITREPLTPKPTSIEKNKFTGLRNRQKHQSH